MKKALIETAALVMLAAMTAGFVMYATSAEVWYADEHTANCNGADNCGCCYSIMSMEER